MIIAKASKELNTPDQKEKLELAALQALDRKVLKSLMDFMPEPEDLTQEPIQTSKKSKNKNKVGKSADVSGQTPVVESGSEQPIEEAAPKNHEIKKVRLGGEKKPEPNAKVKEQQSIIDAFIKANVGLIKIESEQVDTPTSVVDLSEQSARLPANVASENLARMLAKQGKKKQALEIYEKLRLKYPEKSSYFASLIEELKSA